MLPQLDFSHYTSQFFWLLVCLCLLIVVMKNRFIPRMNAIIKKREETIASGNIKLTMLENERNELEQKIAETNRNIALVTANILNEVGIRYHKLLSEQLDNLKHDYENEVRQLRTKYTEDIKAMAEQASEKINLLAEFALQKMIFDGKRI